MSQNTEGSGRRRRRLILAAAALLAAAVGTGGGLLISELIAPERRDPAEATVRIRFGGPFALTDQNGQRVTSEDFRGRFMLIYFGYSFCPDVCPTSLTRMALALEELGDQAEEVQPIFITVDPERDTPEVLAQYVANFHPALLGLTGTKEEIAAAAATYAVYYAKVEPAEGEDKSAYAVDHSNFIFLMDREGGGHTIFPSSASPQRMAEVIRRAL